MLPPGQKARADFPRFGLPPYANRFPSNTVDRTLVANVEGRGSIEIDVGSPDLPRSDRRADLHCVTTWSHVGARWGGVRFVDFHAGHIAPLDAGDRPMTGAVLYAQDGYRTTLLLEDLLRDDVMLADSLDGRPLSVEHGAPLRLVAPEHYGYKNIKHLERIDFHARLPVVKRGVRALLDHPRARVRREERGRWIPGWVLRPVYRLFIARTAKRFEDAVRRRGDGGVS